MLRVSHVSKDLSLGKTYIATQANLILLKPALYSSSLVENFLKVHSIKLLFISFATYMAHLRTLITEVLRL